MSGPKKDISVFENEILKNHSHFDYTKEHRFNYESSCCVTAKDVS